jgi:DNA invertase Pin-like site-specific DNA recombinase
LTSRAVGYTRLSQQSDTSIERQKRHIRAYCDEHDLDLLRIYDDGEQSSGFETESREEYQDLRRRIADGDVDAVVVNDKRRLARDVDEVMRLIPDLRTNDVELHTEQDGRLDLSDPMRAAIEILMAAAAHEEKMEEIEKAIQAIEEKQERGDDLGRPRFGMTYSEDARRQVPGEEFDTVVEVLRLEREDVPYEEISERTGVALGTVSNIVDRREWYVERKQLSEKA